MFKARWGIWCGEGCHRENLKEAIINMIVLWNFRGGSLSSDQLVEIIPLMTASRSMVYCGCMEIKKIHRASCHCKAVEFEVSLPNGLESPRRCDCSFCRMRGAIAASAELDGIKIIKGADKLTLYQFNTNTAKHFFCSVCGIYTHHQRRSNPNQYGFNVACLEGVNPYELGDVPIMDGINHPADRNK